MDRTEQGDTLVELLIAMAIIAVTAGAILGAVITSTVSSTQHRSLSVDDTILKSFAEAAKYQIEFQTPVTSIASGSNGQALPQATINVLSTGGFVTFESLSVVSSAGTQTISCSGVTSTTFTGCTGGTGTLSTGNSVSQTEYSPCAASYVVVGAPNPTTGPIGTKVIAFGAGFNPAGGPVSVTMGGTAVVAPSGLTPDAKGNVAPTFAVPSGLAGTQTVTITQGSVSVASPTGFTVTSGTPSGSGPPEAGYFLGVGSIQYGTPGSGFSGSCPANASLQEIPLTATAPNGVSQQLLFIVRNPNYAP